MQNIYSQLPCTEIWTKGEMLLIFEQLKYAIDSKLLVDKKLISVICKQLLCVLTDVEMYAINSCKNMNAFAQFNWYYCDVVGNVSYLAEREEDNYCFLRFNTFNNFESKDASICAEVRMWLNALLNDAVGFSGAGSKYRNAYLLSLRTTLSSYL